MLALAACVPLAGAPGSHVVAVAPAVQTLFVASTRARNEDGRFGSERSRSVGYSEMEVSVPPHRKLGSITDTIGRLDPSRDFMILGETQFGAGGGFDQALLDHAAAAPGGRGEVMIFVHGFNTTFEESLFRLAQIDHDFRIPSAKVLYAWPTKDRLSQYVHDLESASFARDGLEQLLKRLARSDVSRIVLVGHSMGAQLVVETLRQLRIEGNGDVFGKLGGVVLLSPDMDIDLFRQDARRLAPLPQPFIVYGARDDWPLRAFSSVFTGGKDRLGAPRDFSEIADLDITYIDTSNVGDAGSSGGHLALATSPALIGLVNAMPKADMVGFGEAAERGAIAGATVRRYGELTAVVLPDLAR